MTTTTRQHARSELRPVLHPAIYARVSSYDQDCAMQLREGRDWFARMGYPKPEEFIDHAVSGAKRSRPDFDRLMKLAANPVDLIWVSKIDRFGRSVLHFSESIGRLDNLGVRFVAPSQGIDTDNSSPTGRLLLNLLASIAEFERQLMIERSTAGRMRKFADGEPDSWNLIFGFERGKPILNEKHAQIMRQIFDWRDQDLSFYEIEPMVLAFANKLGVKPPRGKTWWPQSIRKWVASRQCIGEFHRKIDGKVRMYPLPVLIDPVKWTRVNQKGQDIGRRKRGNPKHKYLLTGFLRSEHDKPMSGCTDRGYRYYRCEGVQRRSKITASGQMIRKGDFVGCGCPYRRADMLEGAVWPEIWHYLMYPARAWSLAQALVDEENMDKPKSGRDVQAELDKAKHEIGVIQRSVLAKDGGWTEEEGFPAIRKLREQIVTLETEKRALANVVEIPPLNAVEQAFDRLTKGGEPRWEHRREVLDGLAELRMRLEGDEVIISGKVPLTDANTDTSKGDKRSERLTPGSICHDHIPFVLKARIAA